MSAQPGVVLVNEQKIIHVQSAFPIMPTFQNFSLIATNAQTVFTLPGYPVLSGLFSLNINGVAQDPLNGDFTINGNIMTVNASLSLGDKLAGFFQNLASGISPSVLSYRTFFFTATQGQTLFAIGFVPQTVLYISVNGVLESTNDYTISGQNITLSQGLNAGDNFFGLAIQ